MAFINAQTRQWAPVKDGVSKCFVLGPVLFLVYINDIVNVVQDCNIHLFGDDSFL